MERIDRLLELTSLPTAAGREARVIDWIRAWVDQRADRMEMRADDAGNLVIAHAGSHDTETGELLYFTAHLDHPAFVLEERNHDGRWSATFRGGVRDCYFVDARVRLLFSVE